MDMVAIYDSKEIREIRQKLNLTATEFAYRLGVSATMVAYWERGRSCPKIHIHKQITAMLEAEAKNGRDK